MTTVEEAIEDACTRCGGTGREPGPDEAQAAMLGELAVLGERRARLSTARDPMGMLALEDVYADIRVLVPEARRALTMTRIAEALGLGRQGLYNIVNGKAGG